MERSGFILILSENLSSEQVSSPHIPNAVVKPHNRQNQTKYSVHSEPHDVDTILRFN